MKITKESLMEVFKVENDAAAMAINIIKGKVPDEVLQDFRSVRQLHNYDRDYARLLVLNELLECHGVEAIGEQPDFTASYLNVGETYATTLVHFDDSGKFELTSWGDVVESLGNSEEE